jgi:hypothetical protein
MRRIWHRLFAARPMAQPEDIAPEFHFGKRKMTAGMVPCPICQMPVDRQEYDDLMTLYQLARRKVLSQAEEIEELKVRSIGERNPGIDLAAVREARRRQ